MLNRILLSLLLYLSNPAWMQLCSQDLSAVKTGEGIEILEGSSKILFYQIKPKSLGGKYERTNYIHPLYNLNGNVITEDFPADHPHHHGIFWSWHQIVYDGKRIADGWTSENISWEIVKSGTRKKKNSISLDAEVLWRSDTDAKGQKAIVREHARITVHAAEANYRIIDFDIQLRALVDNLKIGGSDDAKGYGGFSFRLKLPGDIRFFSKDQEIAATELAVDAGPWMDFSGSFDGKDQPESGVAVFCHPSNPGHPQPWILRSEKSMQNVVFPGRAPVDLPAKGLRLQYRMIIHNGKLSPQEIDKLFFKYASSS